MPCRPILPGTCQSIRMRFLAVSAGVHPLDELRLVDMEDGTETRLRRPLTVVVDAFAQ